MKKVLAPLLGTYRNRPQIVLANAFEGASLSVPFTLDNDRLLVAPDEVDLVRSIRTIFASLDLQCIARAGIFGFDKNTEVPARGTEDQGLRLLPARYGKDATLISKKLKVPMEVLEELSDSSDNLTIENTASTEVFSLRHAHKVANTILGLIPVGKGKPGIKVMTNGSETFAPKDFKEFSAVVKDLLARGRKCFIGTTKNSGPIQHLGSVQMLIAERDTDDLVCNVMEPTHNSLAMSGDIDRFEVPSVLTTAAKFLSIHGYYGFASIALGKVQRGTVIPTSISYGFNPELAAAFTAAKVFARDAAVPKWGLAHQTIQPGSMSTTIMSRLADSKLFFGKGSDHGIIPLTLPTVTRPTLNYIVLAKNATTAQTIVERVRDVLQ